jgi:hypothetical protein
MFRELLFPDDEQTGYYHQTKQQEFTILLGFMANLIFLQDRAIV